MTRLMKISALTIGALILLVILSAVILMTFVNPNRFKPQLSQYVKTQTGRELRIDGDISWTFFPHLGLKVTDVQLSNPKDFPNQPFAQVNEADVKLSFLSLLKKQIVAKQLVLKGLQLNLVKNKTGAVNWQIALAQTATHNPQPVSAGQAAAAPLYMNIAKIGIENSGMNYWDQQTDKQFMIKHLNFNSKEVGFNHPFPVHLKFQANSNQDDIKAEFNLTGKLKLNPEQQNYQFTSVDLKVDLQGNKLPNHKIHIDLNTAIAMDEQNLRIKPLKLVLDKQTTLSGELAKNLKNQLVTFNFIIPELILPAGKPGQTQSESSAPAALLPLVLLKDLKANGSLVIDKLVADRFTINAIKTNLNANNGIVQLAPIQAALYQGNYQGQISIDARTNNPSLVMQQSLKKVQLGELLAALGKQTKFPLSGVGDVTLQLTTLGNDLDAWIRNLAGNTSFVISNGSIENIDVEYQLQRVRNFINKNEQPKQQSSNQTRFDSLTGSFQINRGIANNNDLALQAKTATVKGQGSIDLINQTLNYRIQASATSQNLGSDAYKIQDYLGGGLPIVISGKWDNPKVEPDWNVISRAIAKALLKQQMSKYTDTLDEQLEKHLNGDTGKKLKQALDGLFK